METYYYKVSTGPVPVYKQFCSSTGTGPATYKTQIYLEYRSPDRNKYCSCIVPVLQSYFLYTRPGIVDTAIVIINKANTLM